MGICDMMKIGDDVLNVELSTCMVKKTTKLAFANAVQKKHGKVWGNTIFEVDRALQNHIKLMESESNGNR